jgi:hypothetical protein
VLQTAQVTPGAEYQWTKAETGITHQIDCRYLDDARGKRSVLCTARCRAVQITVTHAPKILDHGIDRVNCFACIAKSESED